MRKVVLSLIVFISMIFVGSVKAEETYDSYNIGDQVEVKGEKYHVIADSSATQDYVTLLKDDVLEGNVAYGDNSNFATSNVFNRITTWVNNTFETDDLTEIDGYKYRLLNDEDLSRFGFGIIASGSVYIYEKTEQTPDWVRATEQTYWTMIEYDGLGGYVYVITPTPAAIREATSSPNNRIRPVINASKSIVTKVQISEEDSSSTVNTSNDDNNDSISNESVKVEDTLLQKSLVGTIIGLILIGLGITGYLIGLKLSYKKSR